jgi:TonB family protein
METVVSPPSDPELQLLLQWGTFDDQRRTRKVAIGSVAGHIAVILLLILLPAGAPEEVRPHRPERITPLIEPLTDLTQKAPNKQKVTKDFNALEVQAKPKIQVPSGAPSTNRPRAFRPEAPQPPPVKAASPLPEAPKVEAAPIKPDVPLLAQATPQIVPEERPKLTLENPSAPPPAAQPGQSKIAIPNASIAEAVRQATHGVPSAGMTVGDLDLSGPGGVGPGLNLPPAQGTIGSNLELKSDPQGVDFRPYLTQVLAAVRRNWLNVIPESAKLGRRGLVGIQFSIARAGNVPKLVIVSASGTEALDRAAVAGISASNPFLPLPPEFKGDRIVVQLNFAYNVKK